jgi:glutamine amidotransferase
MIGIIDYGSGNIFSVSNALKKLNIDNFVLKESSQIKDYTTIILPGVGNFKSCINKFKEKNFMEPTLDHVSKGKKLIGICVGMQMLFDSSEENGLTNGMSLLEGEVTLLKPNKNNLINNLPLPNMGWSEIKKNNQNKIINKYFKDIQSLDFYFAHSYACRLKNKTNEIASNKYGDEEYSCIVGKNNIIGIQFHPEKSGPSGLQVLKNIIES